MTEILQDFFDMIIRLKEGINYSKKSRDFNQIHLSDKAGHNSQFGQKIIFGVLILKKILKLKKIHNFNKLSANFIKPFFYNKKILLNILVFQKNGGLLDINFGNENNFKFNFRSMKKSAYTLPKLKKTSSKLFLLLDLISKYVGTIYPKNGGIIGNIKINFYDNKKLPKIFNSSDKKVLIYSKKRGKNLSFIENQLVSEDFLIEFLSFELQSINLKKNKTPAKFKSIINKIKDNVIVFGGSRGLGLELTNLLKKNKKIKIFSTYNLNKIQNKSNIVYKNFFLNKAGINKIFRFILKNRIKYIYYFITPKIYSDIKNSYLLKIYKKYYLYFPSVLIKKLIKKKYKFNFFFPSTSFILNKKSSYTEAKLEAEKKLSLFSQQSSIVNFYRLPEMNTFQNTGILKKKLTSLINFMNNDNRFKKKLFFIK